MTLERTATPASVHAFMRGVSSFSTGLRHKVFTNTKRGNAYEPSRPNIEKAGQMLIQHDGLREVGAVISQDSTLDLDSTRCSMCAAVRAPAPDAWDEPLFESANFVAVTSIGALVPGWLLIVPRKHQLSMGFLSNALSSELHAFKNDVADVLGEIYGPVSAFEHGPSAAKRLAGCGVDHAHLHLVPTTIDLRREAEPFLPSGAAWMVADEGACKRAALNDLDYLYLEQPLGSGSIVAHDGIGSQIFRRVIASALNVPEQFNWREHRQLENVMSSIWTIRAYEQRRLAGCT